MKPVRDFLTLGVIARANGRMPTTYMWPGKCGFLDGMLQHAVVGGEIITVMTTIIIILINGVQDLGQAPGLLAQIRTCCYQVSPRTRKGTFHEGRIFSIHSMIELII